MVLGVGAAETGGALCLVSDFPGAGWTLPPHRHTREAETIHVVAGRFAMRVDSDALELGPGETVHVPAGVRHDGRLLGDEPGHRVVAFTPGGMEDFFVALAVAGDDPRAQLALAEAHGWRFG